MEVSNDSCFDQHFYVDMGSDMEDGGMVYQDEDGNLIMYNDNMMGDEDEEEGDDHQDMMGDSYGQEGSPGVSN